MKIHVSCIDCTNEEHKASGPTLLQINDNSVYSYVCPNGHTNAILLHHEKFELLFESALHAINDGYLREAISSIASCMERVYEFAINVISKKYGLDEENTKLGWNQLGKQSERQLGAFIYLYLIEFKKMPPIVKGKSVEFRNDIIHKGYFPTYEETINFAQEALNNIFEILKNLHEGCSDEIDFIKFSRVKKQTELGKKISLPLISSLHSTIINLSVCGDDFGTKDIRVHLEKIANGLK